MIKGTEIYNPEKGGNVDLSVNEKLEQMPSPDDGDLCHLVCCASEFDNIKVRQEELDEIDTLNKGCFLKINIPTDKFSGKCCVLLQHSEVYA